MSKQLLSEQVVKVDTLEDLCEIVRFNNNVFANHINKLDARLKRTRKCVVVGFIAMALTCFSVEARFCNIEDRLRKQEERLGITAAEEE